MFITCKVFLVTEGDKCSSEFKKTPSSIYQSWECLLLIKECASMHQACKVKWIKLLSLRNQPILKDGEELCNTGGEDVQKKEWVYRTITLRSYMHINFPVCLKNERDGIGSI